MQFTYHKNSGDANLIIDGDLHKYLFKVRRTKSDKNLFFRNLEDNFLYEYEIVNINKKTTQLNLLNSKEMIIEVSRSLHIGWCIVDPKTIEKVIASLNELGVKKISFIYCQFSQKQFKLNFQKLNKILINSSSQCGRSSLMQLDTFNSLDDFLNTYPKSFMFNFSDNLLKDNKDDIETIIIGCEGGFSANECTKIDKKKIVGINSNLIMRSETAAVTLASKILI